MPAPREILELIGRFEQQLDAYKSGQYNETQLRREFLDPFFKALGWDIDNVHYAVSRRGARTRRNWRRNMKPMPRMELDTPLVPRAAAAGVLEEASLWLGQPLPRRWLRELVAEASTIYTHCERFRRGTRRHENRGRDYLWMFMRHWLAAELLEFRPHLHAQMPASYNRGEPLPPMPLDGTLRRSGTSRLTRGARRVPRGANGYAWAAAAHFHGE